MTKISDDINKKFVCFSITYNGKPKSISVKQKKIMEDILNKHIKSGY